MLNRTLSIYRKAYSGLSADTWWLSLIMLINRSGTMVVPFMTIYLTSKEMGYSLGQAGLVVGLFGLGAVCGGFLGGKATDHFGFFPVQLFTLIGGGILFIVLGQVKHLSSICIITFLLSLVNEAYRPANATAIAFYSTDDNRTRSYSLNRLAINLGWAIGAALGGFLASINFELLFWVDGLTNICAAMLMRRIFDVRKGRPAKLVDPAIAPGGRSAYNDKPYLVFVILTTTFALCFFQIFSTLTAYFRNELGYSSAYIGFLMALNGLIITFVEMVIVYKLEGRYRDTVYIVFGVLLCSLAYFLLIAFPSTKGLAVVMIVLITFGEILSMPFMNTFWISRSTESNRGQYAGLFTIAWSAAHTLGPLIGSQIAERNGFEVLWIVNSSLCGIAALGFLLLDRFQKTI